MQDETDYEFAYYDEDKYYGAYDEELPLDTSPVRAIWERIKFWFRYRVYWRIRNFFTHELDDIPF